MPTGTYIGPSAPHRQQELRCHRCSYYIGETDSPVEFVGIVKKPSLTKLAEPPRQSFQCGKCGWTNIFSKSIAA